MNIIMNEEIFEDKDIPYVVKGVWASICAKGKRQGTLIYVPQYIKESKEFRYSVGYLEYFNYIKGINDANDILLN